MEKARRIIVWGNSLGLVFLRNDCGLSGFVTVKKEIYKNKGVWLIRMYCRVLVNAGSIVPAGKYSLR